MENVTDGFQSLCPEDLSQQLLLSNPRSTTQKLKIYINLSVVPHKAEVSKIGNLWEDDLLGFSN